MEALFDVSWEAGGTAAAAVISAGLTSLIRKTFAGSV